MWADCARPTTLATFLRRRGRGMSRAKPPQRNNKDENAELAKAGSAFFASVIPIGTVKPVVHCTCAPTIEPEPVLRSPSPGSDCPCKQFRRDMKPALVGQQFERLECFVHWNTFTSRCFENQADRANGREPD